MNHQVVKTGIEEYRPVRRCDPGYTVQLAYAALFVEEVSFTKTSFYLET